MSAKRPRCTVDHTIECPGCATQVPVSAKMKDPKVSQCGPHGEHVTTAGDYFTELKVVTEPMRFPVRLGNQLLICELNDRGEIEVPLGAMIDIELTGLIEGLLKEAGIPGEDVEDTMNKLRVQYVMGRDVTVEAASTMLDEQPYAEGGEEL